MAKDKTASSQPPKPLGYIQGTGDTYQPEVLIEKRSKPARVISQLNHPVTISYGGNALIIPPMGRPVVANMDMLGALPRGVFVVPAPELTR